MLQEFTEDDRLREQYRLHEAWVRDRRYEESAKKKMKEELAKERKLRKQEARKRKESEREKEKSDRKREELERKNEELEKKSEEAERKIILALRKKGLSDKEIAEMLDMPEDAVRQII